MVLSKLDPDEKADIDLNYISSNGVNQRRRTSIVSESGLYSLVLRDNEPWFVAADVCRALEIGNPSDALRRLDDDERQTTLVLIEGGYGAKSEKEVNIVSESGIYSLVLGSRGFRGSCTPPRHKNNSSRYPAV